jgi:hypothetical protein
MDFFLLNPYFHFVEPHELHRTAFWKIWCRLLSSWNCEWSLPCATSLCLVTVPNTLYQKHCGHLVILSPPSPNNYIKQLLNRYLAPGSNSRNVIHRLVQS